MKIHHVFTSYVDRYVIDPALGPVKRREELIKQSDVTSITWEGNTYLIQPDGSFDVPDAAGHFLTSRASAVGRWYEGPNPYAAERLTKAEALSENDEEDTASHNARRQPAKRRRPSEVSESGSGDSDSEPASL